MRVAPEQANQDLILSVFGHLQTLVKLHVLLTRREIEGEIRKRVGAVIILATGAGCVMLAAIVLSLAFVHGLHWLTLPNAIPTTELAVSGLPLWACHAIISLALAVLGTTLIAVGRRRIHFAAAFQHTSCNPSKADHS